MVHCAFSWGPLPHHRVYDIGESVGDSDKSVLRAASVCCLCQLGIALLVVVHPSLFLNCDLQCCTSSLPRSGWIECGVGHLGPPECYVLCFVFLHPFFARRYNFRTAGVPRISGFVALGSTGAEIG